MASNTTEMQPNPLALPVVDMFEKPVGREYALQWTNGTGKGQSGMIRMTDFLFNYCFYPTAFGLDGAYREVQVAAKSSITMTRRIGGPSINYSRSGYTRKIVPTWRGGAYDSGTQCFYIDGKDVWNFEISGRIEEFRIWLQKAASSTNLKRPFTFRTETGVGSSVAPFTSTAP